MKLFRNSSDVLGRDRVQGTHPRPFYRVQVSGNRVQGFLQKIILGSWNPENCSLFFASDFERTELISTQTGIVHLSEK